MSMNTTNKQTARAIALNVLLEVEGKKAFSNLELHAALRRSDLPRKDAGLATGLVYGTLSRLNTLDWMAGQVLKKPMNKLEPWVRNLIRLLYTSCIT